MSTAFVVVDVQVDFCEGGALPIVGGNQVAADIATHLAEHHQDYEVIAFTQDWHTSLEQDPSGNGGHFAIPPAEPDYVTTWPVHCEARSLGAQLHSALDPFLDVTPNLLRVRKGQGVPGYSAFDGSLIRPYRTFGANLGAVLMTLDIDEVVVVGLAYEHCVMHTACDAGNYGPGVSVLRDLTAAANPNAVARTDRRLDAADVVIK